MKAKLPKEIEKLPEGMYKKDMIRHFKKTLRQTKNSNKPSKVAGDHYGI